MAQSEGQRAREICESARFIGLTWLGKTMDQLTDQECIDMLKYIYEMTGTTYYMKYSGRHPLYSTVGLAMHRTLTTCISVLPTTSSSKRWPS